MTYAANGMSGSVTHRTGSAAVLEKWDTATGTQDLWSAGNCKFDRLGQREAIGRHATHTNGMSRLTSWVSEGAGGVFSATTRSFDDLGNVQCSAHMVAQPAATHAPRGLPATRNARDHNHYDDVPYDGAGNMVFDGAQVTRGSRCP